MLKHVSPLLTLVFMMGRRGGTGGARAMDMPESVYREEDQEDSGDDEDKEDQDEDEGRFQGWYRAAFTGIVGRALDGWPIGLNLTTTVSSIRK